MSRENVMTDGTAEIFWGLLVKRSKRSGHYTRHYLSFFFLSMLFAFLQERVIMGLQKFAWAPNSQNIRIKTQQKIWGPPSGFFSLKKNIIRMLVRDLKLKRGYILTKKGYINPNNSPSPCPLGGVFKSFFKSCHCVQKILILVCRGWG